MLLAWAVLYVLELYFDIALVASLFVPAVLGAAMLGGAGPGLFATGAATPFARPTAGDAFFWRNASSLSRTSGWIFGG